MNYIIFDLEFNQKPFDTSQNNYNHTPSLSFEIIQIGALKLSESFETISDFNALIKPSVFPSIHPFIEILTGINNAAVSSCKSFPQVYEEFLKFIGDEETIFCVWGLTDIKELIRNMKYYDLSFASISKSYIDIQRHASEYFNAPKDSKISLRTAINLLNLPANAEFHDALNDASYTAEVFKKIYNDNMKPQTYVVDKPKRGFKRKVVIDSEALIKQFEKMYEREISEEEKTMILLSYNMGRTRQFVIETDID